MGRVLNTCYRRCYRGKKTTSVMGQQIKQYFRITATKAQYNAWIVNCTVVMTSVKMCAFTGVHV